MLEGKLTREQIAIIMNMCRLVLDREGIQGAPVIGDMVRALQSFKAPVDPPAAEEPEGAGEQGV